MATEHFCLRWNNHQSTLVSVFDNLLESGTLVDCTLAADGRYLKAHKVVLSACSPYLGMLLSQHYDKHPIIILKDVKFDELKAMLDYMYRGEVNISQEQLSTFLKAAETLQIKGLTDAGSDEGNGLQPNRPPSSNSTTSANEDPQSPGPPGDGGSSPGPRKRKRNKHGDDGEGDSVSKISLSEGSDRLSSTSVGSPSGAKTASVKREPGDGEGDGQMSVDESADSVMMSRPGPSNGGTNNKAPWILSADSSGEEMQLTPGQDGEEGARKVELRSKEMEKTGNITGIIEEIKIEVEEKPEEQNESDVESFGFVYRGIERSEDELIIPDPLEPDLETKISTLEASLGKECLNNLHSSAIPEPAIPSKCKKLYSTSDPSDKHQPPRLTLQSLSCLQVQQPLSSTPMPSSKTVADVCDIFHEKTTLDFNRKFRKILPAPEDNSTNLNMQNTQFSCSNPKDSTVLNIKTYSRRGSISSTKILSGDETSVIGVTQQDINSNNQQIQGSPVNNPIPSSVLSISQQIQGSQISNHTPSVLSIPKQLHGSHISNSTPVLAIPQQLQGNQINNATASLISIPQSVNANQTNNSASTMLSLSPQFSISTPMQTSSIQMHYNGSSDVQTGTYQNSQFFGNSNAMAPSQIINNQNSLLSQHAQVMSHPMFVTSSIISSPQTSSQFLPPSAVQSNFSSSTTQPIFNNQISQSNLNMATSKVNVSTSTSTPSSTMPSKSEHFLYMRTPDGFVQVTPQVTKGVISTRPFSPRHRHTSGRGRLPSQLPSIRPKSQNFILPKK